MKTVCKAILNKLLLVMLILLAGCTREITKKEHNVIVPDKCSQMYTDMKTGDLIEHQSAIEKFMETDWQKDELNRCLKDISIGVFGIPETVTEISKSFVEIESYFLENDIKQHDFTEKNEINLFIAAKGVPAAERLVVALNDNPLNLYFDDFDHFSFQQIEDMYLVLPNILKIANSVYDEQPESAYAEYIDILDDYFEMKSKGK